MVLRIESVSDGQIFARCHVRHIRGEAFTFLAKVAPGGAAAQFIRMNFFRRMSISEYLKRLINETQSYPRARKGENDRRHNAGQAHPDVKGNG